MPRQRQKIFRKNSVNLFRNLARAPRHVGHPKGFTVTPALQSIHELLQSSSLNQKLK